jgi:hypothetical protein
MALDALFDMEVKRKEAGDAGAAAALKRIWTLPNKFVRGLFITISMATGVTRFRDLGIL